MKRLTLLLTLLLTLALAGTGWAAPNTYFVDGTSYATGSVTSGTFVLSELVTQATSGATAYIADTVTGSGNIILSSVIGSPDSSHAWTGGTSGAVYTPTSGLTYNGNDASAGTSWATAVRTPDTARAKITAGNGDTVLVYKGYYYGSLNLLNLSSTRNGCTWLGTTVRGTAANASVAAQPLVIIKASTTTGACNVSGSGITIKYFTFYGGASAAYYPILCSGSPTFFNCTLGSDNTTNMGVPVATISGSTTCNNCNFVFGSATVTPSYYLSISGSGTVTVNYGSFNSESLIPPTGIICSSSANFNFNNSIMMGGQYVLNWTGSGTANITNCILNISCSTTPVIIKSAGAVNVYTSFINSGPFSNPAAYVGAGVSVDTFTAANYGSNPRFTSYERTGYVIPSITVNEPTVSLPQFDETLNLEPLLAAKGWKGYVKIESSIWTGTFLPRNSDLLGLASRGTIEIGSHGANGNPFDATTYGYFTYSGSDTPATYTIDLTNHLLKVISNTNVDTVTYNFTDTVNNTDLFSTALAYIQAQKPGKWSFTYDTSGAVICKAGTPMSSLAAATGAAVATHVSLNLSNTNLSSPTTGFYWDEIALSKSYFENLIQPTVPSYSCVTIGGPSGAISSNAQTASRTGGYTSLLETIISNNGTQVPTSYNLYWVEQIYAGNLLGATSTITKQNTRNVAYAAIMAGKAICMVDDQCALSTSTYNGWPAILDALAEFGSALKVTSVQQFASDLHNAPWTYNSGTGIATRTYTTPSNYVLKAGSPCIKAGTNVSLTTDYYGNTVHNPPNIGLDDNQTFPSGGGLGLGLGLGLGGFPGWQHRPTQ